MKKKITLLFAMLAVCLSGMAAVNDTFDKDGWSYKVLTEEGTNGTVSIKPTNKNDITGKVVVPTEVTHDGKTYTVVGFQSSRGQGYFGSGITSIVIPDNFTSIPTRAFSGCSGLTSIILPENVVEIGEYAFSGCTALSSVTLSKNTRSIDDTAFSGCTGLGHIELPIGGTSKYAAVSDGNMLIDNETKKIKVVALKELKAISIPAYITDISDNTFKGCTTLESVTFESPSSLTTIEQYAFSGCTSLTSINLPNSVTSIGGYTFSGCTGLTSITIPSSVTSIDGSTFYGCTGLTSITIPSSVTSIGNYTFQNCTSLTSITIPSSVTSIGITAFYNCSNLETVTFEGTPNFTSNTIFQNCTNLTTVNVPADASDDYISELTSKSLAEDKIKKCVYSLKEGVDYAITDVPSGETVVVYNRSFNNQNWQALFLPIEVEAAEWSADFEVATLTSYDATEKTLTWTTVAENTDLAAGTPYIIRPKSASGATLLISSAEKTLVTNTTINNVVVGPEGDKVTLSGTYAEKTMNTTPTGMDANYHYWGLSEGNFYYTNSEDKKLKPYRIFLIAKVPTGSSSAQAPIRINIVDENTTEIEEIAFEEIFEAPAVNLQGQRVGDDYKGIVIVNGKKILRK